MNGWRLVPETISSVLTNTQTAVASVAQGAQTVFAGPVDDTHPTGSTEESPLALVQDGAGDIVAGALFGFLEEQLVGVKSAMGRYNVGIAATVASTNAYLSGEEQIADGLLAAASDAAATGDLTRFGGQS